MTKRSLALCFALTGALALCAHGQMFDVDGPNATLTLNGQTPSVADPTGHQVTVQLPGSLDIGIGSGGNPTQGFYLLAGPLNAGVFATPWGGSIPPCLRSSSTIPRPESHPSPASARPSTTRSAMTTSSPTSSMASRRRTASLSAA